VALKRAGCCVVSFGGHVNCTCVPQLFQQLINIVLCPVFSGNSSVNLFAVYLFKYRLFLSKSCFRRWIPCCLLTMTSAVTNFWCHNFITIVNKNKNTDMKNFICNRYGERLHILNTENIIFLHFLSYRLNICKNDFFISQGSAVTMPKVRWIL